MQEEAFNEIIQRLDRVEDMLKEKQKQPKEVFLDNAEFLQVMHISKRTAQQWRDSGIISFSQIGNKIFYRMTDIQELLEKHRQKSYNPKGIRFR
ncbi:MAG: helix-turn-helix domain-containing protein [Chitinophagales bacterium]|nr:helix-turn-helix domain-containing protein [Chitinophagales bacterium]